MKIPTLVLMFFLVMVNTVKAQDWGVGLRIGDPLGLTLMKKLGDSRALEFNFGRTGYYGGTRYYNQYTKKDYKKNGYYDYDDFYYGYSNGLSIQVNYLFRYAIEKIGSTNTNGLGWYWGVGGQLRMLRFDYTGFYQETQNGPWVYREGTETSLGVGPTGVIGMDYTFPDAPFTLFADLMLFVEFFEVPGNFLWQGGIGGRYNF